MRILFVADGRSPIALNWIRYFSLRGDEVHLVSTYPCRPDLDLASLHILALPLSPSEIGTVSPGVVPVAGRVRWARKLVPPSVRTGLRRWIVPLALPRRSAALLELVRRLHPQLVHALRIPYEGMLAGAAWSSQTGLPPLLISIWGNDFTLHAGATPWTAHFTRLALEQASGLHADCRRDIRLGNAWGFDARKPAVVLPGAGGVQPDVFYPPERSGAPREALVVNPRGFRAYVRNDVFFRSIPAIHAARPDVRFACPVMAGEAQAEKWTQELDIEAIVDLMPRLSRRQMADLFRRAQVAVSPSVHDGTPNTLLEAMACGCFPVAGDLESLREWITPGVNGLLVDPTDPAALADAVLLALDQFALREQAAGRNRDLIAARADYQTVMQTAAGFYQKLIDS